HHPGLCLGPAVLHSGVADFGDYSCQAVEVKILMLDTGCWIGVRNPANLGWITRIFKLTPQRHGDH
ncbi:MAG: hypothetical protein KDH84_02190, partial [Calditrichaeota bacterium]|nr:hypothetical protein [Calditrichota bacterium]